MTLKPELDLELNGSCNGIGIDNSPSLPLMRTSPCACLLAPLLYGRHNSGGHVAISQTRFISCGRQTGGVCESSLFPSSPCPSVARPAVLVRGRGRPP